MRLATVGIVIAAAILVSAHAAFAHAVLVRSMPAPDAVLSQAPPDIRLTFNENIEPRFSTVEVAAGKTRVATERARLESGRSNELVPRLPPLKPGRYRVIWRMVSADSQEVSGTFKFDLAP